MPRRSRIWREAAHTIKGSASAVGAWRLARFAEMAEQVDIEAGAGRAEGHRDEAVARRGHGGRGGLPAHRAAAGRQLIRSHSERAAACFVDRLEFARLAR